MLRSMFIDFLKMVLAIAVCFAIFSGVRVLLHGMQSLFSSDYAEAVELALIAGIPISLFFGVFNTIYNRFRGHRKNS